MKIGYARVSTPDQSLELQIDELKKYGCERIFNEKISAAKSRPELDKMNQTLRSGDTVVVWKLDRLGRSLKHLVNQVNDYKENGIELIIIQDNIDTSTPQGRLMFNMFAIFAEFERELIGERTKAGLVAARAKGAKVGRPSGFSKESKGKAFAILGMLAKKDDKGVAEHSVSEIMRTLKISKSSYYRLKEWAENQQ